MREELPEWAEEVIPSREEIPPSKNISLDRSLATRDFRVTYRGFRECVIDLVRQLRAEVLREEAEASKPSSGKERASICPEISPHPWYCELQQSFVFLSVYQ